MPPREYNKIKVIAKAVTPSQDWEDIAQGAAVRLLCSRVLHPTRGEIWRAVKWEQSDSHRKVCGSKVRKGSKREPLVEWVLSGDESLWPCTPAEAEDDLMRAEKWSFLRGLEGRERRIIELYSQGYTQEEIGFDLGVTEARVCQLLKDIRKRDVANNAKSAAYAGV